MTLPFAVFYLLGKIRRLTVSKCLPLNNSALPTGLQSLNAHIFSSSSHGIRAATNVALLLGVGTP